MRTPLAAALLLLAACVTVPPLRPADPAQAVANERSAAAAAAGGVRVVARPAAWTGGGDDLEEYLTPVDVRIQNGGGRALRVSHAAFSLLAPGGFRYEALSTDEVRHALGPYRGAVYGPYASFLGPYAWAPFYPWGGPWTGWWDWGFGPAPWWGSTLAVPTRAFARGTLEPGGSTSVLLFFPVAATSLTALELDVNLADTSGQSVAALRLPFVREGQRPVPTPLPPTAAPPPEAPAPWQTEPPPRTAPPPAQPR